MVVLLAALLAALPAADTTAPLPVQNAPAPISISLNNDGNYTPGGLVQVRVQTTDDGYLTVFRVDADGKIRVLFPLDPDGDAFVRGGKEYELRGREDAGTFLADNEGGTGMVYAAISHTPYQFRDFTANGHWDYNALRLPDSSSDAETDLTALISTMTNRSRFDYDAVGYRVEEVGDVTTAVGVGNGYYPGFYDPYYNPSWRCLGCGWGTGIGDIGLNFGYSPYWDPYLYSPWAYSYGLGYGGYYGGGWFPGTYPIYGGGARTYRARPVPAPRPSVVAPRARAPIGNVRGGVASPPVGVRARPRPADLQNFRPERVARPAFRQPTNGYGQPQGARVGRPEPTQRPAYREPPRVERSAPQAERNSPPPAARSAPQQRSAPASRPAPAPRGGGGGGRRH
ncbi:MAG TPA: DUF4384 domain-containing protein [Gemmatimonadales bacterium]|jgi:hypothetical protein